MTCGRHIGPYPCCSIVHTNAESLIQSVPEAAVIIADPPFNIGYHYDIHKDKQDELEYLRQLTAILRPPCVLVHYPEMAFKFSLALGQAPTKCVAWVYNANTPRQWRMISWFGIVPDFKRHGQAYKNPTDKRVKKLIAAGRQARLYDWWEVQQVKNVSKAKAGHPCQMPLDVLIRTVAVSSASLVVDPYAGTGTTLVAAKQRGVHFLGCDVSAAYVTEAERRLAEIPLNVERVQCTPAQ